MWGDKFLLSFHFILFQGSKEKKEEKKREKSLEEIKDFQEEIKEKSR